MININYVYNKDTNAIRFDLNIIHIASLRIERNA